MAIQSLPTVNLGGYQPSYSLPSIATQNRGQGAGQQLTAAPTRSAVLSAESYSSQKLYLEYTNKDGDTVSLQYESLQVQKAQLAVTSSGHNPQEWQAIVDKIQDEFKSLQQEIIKQFVESTTGSDESGQAKSSGDVQAAQVPEYWNAENTSQRIVDFAVSFLDLFSGSTEEYFKMMKDAVEKGFSMARDLMGDMPDPVKKLADDTYALVMQKLDAWARQQGIGTETPEQTAQQTATA